METPLEPGDLILNNISKESGVVLERFIDEFGITVVLIHWSGAGRDVTDGCSEETIFHEARKDWLQIQRAG